MPRTARPAVLQTETVQLSAAQVRRLELDLRLREYLVGRLPAAKDRYRFWRVTVTDNELPDISAAFAIVELDKELDLLRWMIQGSGVPNTGDSRLPLHTWSRIAGFALVDALEQGIYQNTYKTNERERVDHPYERKRRPSLPRRRIHDIDPTRATRAADAYRAAIKQGRNDPTVATAEALNVSRTTAARALDEARQRGLVGPALPNRAGEARPPKKKR